MNPLRAHIVTLAASICFAHSIPMYAADNEAITSPTTEEGVRKAFEKLEKKLVLILADNAKSRESFLFALDDERTKGPIATQMNNALRGYAVNGDFHEAKEEAYAALELAKKAAHDRCNKKIADILAADSLDSYAKQMRIAYAERARDVACEKHIFVTDTYIKALVTISDRLDAAATPLCTTYYHHMGDLGRPLEDGDRELRAKLHSSTPQYGYFYLFNRCGKIEQRRRSRIFAENSYRDL